MKQRKFTLIELIVILSIITILMSLLVPALKQAMHKTEELGCKSNFRQTGTAFAAYSSDNNSVLPAVSDDNSTGGSHRWPGQWFMHLCAYVGYNEWYPGPKRSPDGSWSSYASFPSELTPNIFACPSAVAGYNSQQFGNNIQLGVGMNRFLTPEGVDPDNFPNAPKLYNYPRLSLINNPSTRLLIADAMGYNLGTYWSVYAWHRETRPDNSFNRARHNGSCNVLFVDGHVETPTDEEVHDKIFKYSSWSQGRLFHSW